MTTTNSLRRSPLWRLAAALSLLLLCGAGAPPSLALEATPAWLGGDEVAVKVNIRADYIFYSDGLELASSEVIPTLASDHLPVTAVFRLQRAAPSKYGIGH